MNKKFKLFYISELQTKRYLEFNGLFNNKKALKLDYNIYNKILVDRKIMFAFHTDIKIEKYNE